MASIICITCKERIVATHNPYTSAELGSRHVYAIIAKGNSIEGIEARE